MTGPRLSGTAMLRRAERIATLRAARLGERLAAALLGLPGIRASAEAGRVVVSGRRLHARRLRDARLRWIAGWLR